MGREASSCLSTRHSTPKHNERTAKRPSRRRTEEEQKKKNRRDELLVEKSVAARRGSACPFFVRAGLDQEHAAGRRRDAASGGGSLRGELQPQRLLLPLRLLQRLHRLPGRERKHFWRGRFTPLRTAFHFRRPWSGEPLQTERRELRPKRMLKKERKICLLPLSFAF